MSDDLTVARDRAREVVGDGVWEKLSATAQANAIREELRLMTPARDVWDDMTSDPTSVILSRR